MSLFIIFFYLFLFYLFIYLIKKIDQIVYTLNTHVTLLLNEEMILSKLSLFLCFFFEIIFYFITNFISFFNFLLIFFILLFYSILHGRASRITEAADFLGRVPLMQKKKCLILQERGDTISKRKSPCTNSHKPLQEISTTA